MRILIVEDEEALATGLQFNFEQEGYRVTVAADGKSALEAFQQADPAFDLVILDLMLPGMSGYETCRSIRSMNQQIPVLVLSARTLSQDKALAFDAGSDQYMTKPFALPELLSRVRNLIERHSKPQSDTDATNTVMLESFQFGDRIHIDFSRFQIDVRGKTFDLTTKELQLLRYLVTHEGLVVSRAQIMEDVWEESVDLTTRTIDNFVLRLRRYIEPDPANPQHILSVRGTGYRFVSEFTSHNRLS